MRLSVVILNRDRSATLRRSLSALRAQDPPAHEIIVVDNGSSDDSLAMLERDFPEVRVIALGENTGIRGRNVGFREASGDLILSLDNDIELLDPGSLGRLIGEMEQRPLAAAATLKLCEEASGDEHVAGYWWHPRERYEYQDRPFETDYFSEAAVVFRSGPLRAAGGYYEPLFWGSESWDLALTLIAQGFELWYLPVPVLHLAPRGDLRTQPSPRHANLIRNRLWIACRRLPTAAALCYALPRVLLWGARSVRYGYFAEYVRGISGFLQRLPEILRAREVISARSWRRIRILRRGVRSTSLSR